MKFEFKNKKIKIKHKKDGRINPHKFWVIFMIIFVIVFTLEILTFTYLFLTTTKSLDAVVAPRLETNSGQIQKIQKTIEETKASIESRINK